MGWNSAGFMRRARAQGRARVAQGRRSAKQPPWHAHTRLHPCPSKVCPPRRSRQPLDLNVKRAAAAALQRHGAPHVARLLLSGPARHLGWGLRGNAGGFRVRARAGGRAVHTRAPPRLPPNPSPVPSLGLLTPLCCTTSAALSLRCPSSSSIASAGSIAAMVMSSCTWGYGTSHR